MITHHQFIEKYPIKRESRKLILGTIHPHDVTNFQLAFFYGNKLSIWKILNEAFDKAFGDVISLQKIIMFLEKRKIAISDTIISCSRINPTALDSDLIPKELNYELVNQIRNSSIEEILFTSGFGKNNAFKLFFCDILKQKITKQIKAEKGLLLDSSYFGRPIKLTVLISPSGSANGSISRSKAYKLVKHKYIKFPTPVKQFRIDFYKSKFL